jgi:hypothetical protein
MRNYKNTYGIDMTICQVIVLIDQAEKVHVLRKVPFQKTNADVPKVIMWIPLDLADVNGDEKTEIILRGDAYEDHWLEVVGMKNSSFETIYSGLGYYL